MERADFKFGVAKAARICIANSLEERATVRERLKKTSQKRYSKGPLSILSTNLGMIMGELPKTKKEHLKTS